ncbi:hypothetical protein GSI_04394 [Ganoderma sinense ZZ0214-1]|uniref:Uncharacterized protein n=1 Tax=Ganoderma sinense ZZ0214-1 TaxID=1077348 RepID=A0A2G8SJ29_9APHY|nr:hypothetical protein GSI_04394 [Ganoderma sinense ZZ0214-1]
MSSPEDLEKAEKSQPLLVEVSTDDLISPPVVPEGGNKRRTLFFLVYTICVLFYLHMLGRLWLGRVGDDQVQVDDNTLMQCHLDSVNFTEITTSENAWDSPYRAHASTSLPVFSKELSFVALGDLSAGTFQISQSLEVGADATVDITVLYDRPEVLYNVSICHLHPSPGKRGLAFITSKWPGAKAEHKVEVNIHVRLPANADPRSPLVIKELRTYLPQYMHIIPDLSESVHFGRIHLTSHNRAGIEAQGLRADDIKIEAGVGPITGTYNATSVLMLDTSNSPIAVRANLLGGAGRVVHLYMKTSNGFIDSQIGMYSNATNATGGAFSVNARTANSPLKLAFVDAPADSVLHADAGTSNSPAQVRLHETFEGAFSLMASAFLRPVVEWKRDAEDPAGRGRERTVKVNAVKDSLVTGNVFWGEQEGMKRRGTVRVATSNSPVRLIL